MDYETFFDKITNALDEQMRDYEITGIIKPLVMPEFSVDNLTVEASDPPDVRRRVILFKSKLRSWAATNKRLRNELETLHNYDVDNIQAMIEGML